MRIWRHWEDRTPLGKEWGYTWCAPCEDMNELNRRLRHGDSVSRTDALAAASIISCYQVLVEMSERDRRKVLREIRKGPTQFITGPNGTVQRVAEKTSP